MHMISASASIGADVTLDVERLTVGPDAVIGDRTVIEAEEVSIDEGVRIGRGVSISTKRLSLGRGGRIEDRCVLSGTKAAGELIDVGDRFHLGHDSKLLMPLFVAGDYVSLHNHLLATGYKPCVIGHNTWVGQNCVLNATGGLTIGNNVGIGAYSSIYSHGYFGELLEGCEVFNVGEVTIADDAWLVGAYNVVSPGVSIGRRAIVLTSSVLTHDVPAERCVAGSPVRDLTDRIEPFRTVTLEDKVEMMERFVEEYVTAEHDQYQATANGFKVSHEDGGSRVIEVRSEVGPGDFADGEVGVVFAAASAPGTRFEGVTVFNLDDKTYGKLGHEFEASVISFMNSYRARFVPADRPTVKFQGE